MTQHIDLKPQELEILKLVAAGLSNKEIADRVHLAQKTIEHMLGTSDPFRSIFLKIQVSNRTQAAAWYAHHYGWGDAQSNSRSLIDRLFTVYSDYPLRAYQVRIAGQPRLALDMLLFLKGQVQSFLQENRTFIRNDACHRLYTEALVQEALVYLEVVPRQKIVSMMQPLFREFKTISKELEAPHVSGLGHLSLAGAYNIAKQYAVGQKLYRNALDLLDNDDLQLRALRGLAISSAFLADAEQVEYATVETQKRRQEGRFSSIEQLCETVEGVAKARGILRFDDTYKWVEESEHLLGKLGNHPLRNLQIIASKLEILCRLEPRSLTEIERLGEQGLELARTYGYQRHQDSIQERLMALT